MPLLNKKPLELHKYSKKLPDEKEVFYCEYTNEIFEDYEEYCQRVIACNSLIWTCAITGKSDLTYQEALVSEETALKAIKDFPLELRTPLLYLASRAKYPSFNEMSDKVFWFAKDRYFLGETVEAYFGEEAGWVFGHVLQVLLPTEDEVAAYEKARGMARAVSKRPYPGALYRYEVEELDDDAADGDVTEVRTLQGDHVRRVRGAYTKDKNRIYLKQFAEAKDGYWGIQDQILKKYSITTIRFAHLFVGDPPLFESPRKLAKMTQQGIRKFLVKKSPNSKKPDSPKRKVVGVKTQKKYEETIDKVVQQSRKDAQKQDQLEEKAKKLEELRKKKEKEKAEKAKLADFVKEWQRKREDLECEDLKDLPSPCPVDCRVPNECFGDFAMVLEFFFCFGEVINVKDYFPYGLRFDLLERALVDSEIAGPLSDIIQLLLTTLFHLQEVEDDQVQNTLVLSEAIDEAGDISMAAATRMATAAASWSKTHLGVPLKDLSLDCLTLTEVLRLHLLSSGGRAGDMSCRWRYQERGGYVSTDDPGLLFRLQEPQILRALAVKAVAELSVVDKLKILTCLTNQILTYAEVRDVIDERYDKMKAGKIELRNDQIAESKREREATAQKLKERREAKEKGETVVVETEEEKRRSEKEANKKKTEFQKRTMELQKAAMESHVLPLGQDRAHRRFWSFAALPGLFVEDDERWPGSCLAEPTSKMINQDEDTMAYVRKLFEEERLGGSDKENEGDSSLPLSSPKKKTLGEANGVRGASPIKSPSKDEAPVNRLVCTAKQDTCPVHGRVPGKTTWCFYYLEPEIDELISCLNKRGYREHGLRKALMEERERIVAALPQCPVAMLNRFVPVLRHLHHVTPKTTRSCKGYENANLSYPKDTPLETIQELYIREVILDTEEKIYHGGLGALKARSRLEWRAAIESGGYDKQTDSLTWPQYPVKKKSAAKEERDEREEGGSRPETPLLSDVTTNKVEQRAVVRDMASMVLQMGRAIEPKYLQKPLKSDKAGKLTAMERWEMSLMAATSLSQVYLHLDALENSIQWNKSVLNARCKLCRRTKDDENMLLCDECNRGFHLYCLKPKLTAIPKGDWFCPSCRPKEPVEKRKPRRLFLEESEGEEEPRTRRRRRDDSTEEAAKPRWRRRGGSDASSDEPLSKVALQDDERRSRRPTTSSDEPLSKLSDNNGLRSRQAKRRMPSVESGDEPLSKMARPSRRSLRTRPDDD